MRRTTTPSTAASARSTASRSPTRRASGSASSARPRPTSRSCGGLEAAGVDQWNIYLMTHGQEETLEAYGREIIPALRGSSRRRLAPIQAQWPRLLPRRSPVLACGTVVLRSGRSRRSAASSLFAAYTLFGPARLDDFFNRYWYNALILLAAGAAVVRAVTTRTERNGLDRLRGRRSARWAVGEILFDFAYGGAPPYPSVADAFYLAFYPACYVGMVLLVRHRLSEFRRDGLVRRDHGGDRRGGARDRPCCSRSCCSTPTAARRVIVTNLAYPLGDVLLLSAVVGVFALTGWKPDRTWGLIGAALLADHDRRRDLPLPDGDRHVRRGDAPRRTVAGVDAAAGRGGLAARPRHVDVPLEGRPLLATSLVCGCDRPGDPHLRPLRPAQPRSRSGSPPRRSGRGRCPASS